MYADVGLRQFAADSLKDFGEGTRLTRFANHNRVIGTTKIGSSKYLVVDGDISFAGVFRGGTISKSTSGAILYHLGSGLKTSIDTEVKWRRGSTVTSSLRRLVSCDVGPTPKTDRKSRVGR